MNKRIYSIWRGMRQRCADATNKYHGGKGIRVCRLWRDDFEAFERWSLANGYRDDATIDRKNSNRHYTPANCRWTDGFGQALTNSRNRKLHWNGRLYSTGELAKKFGIKRQTLNNRLTKGWGLKKALAVPEMRRRLLCIDGEQLSLREAARRLEINYDTLVCRIKRYGWSDSEAIEKAVRGGSCMRKSVETLQH